MLTVFGHPKSTCTLKVVTTLIEKDQPYNFVQVDIRKGEQKLPDHLQRHPFGVVPVLQDGDFLLYESRAIIRYLDKKFLQNPLTPAAIENFGQMEKWISVEQSYFSGPVVQVAMQRVFAPLVGKSPDETLVSTAMPKISAVLAVINKTLEKQPYLAGDLFSLADICWMPYFYYLDIMKLTDIIHAQPHAKKWWETVSKRPAWVAATS